MPSCYDCYNQEPAGHNEWPKRKARVGRSSEEGKGMKRVLSAIVLLMAVAVVALAGAVAPPSTPEIDGATAVGALTLLGGTLVVIRAWRKR